MSCSMTCDHTFRFLFIGDHFGHDRLLGNLGHLFGLLVEEIGASQQGQHQQHHDGGHVVSEVAGAAEVPEIVCPHSHLGLGGQ